MRILISGGCGFIGCNLVRIALARGHHVHNVDALTYAGNLSSLKHVDSDVKYGFDQVDLRDFDALRDTLFDFRPDAVMHLAAETHNDRSIDEPSIFVETNVVGTYHLLQASLEYYRQLDSKSADDFRFVHVSTDEVFGSLTETGSFNEQSRYDPHSPYSASKAASDHFARVWHHTYGLPVIVSNSSNNYGPYQYPEKLIPVVILKCLRDEPVPIYGTGTNVRDWLFVEDHCDGLLSIVERGVPGETYGFGGGHEKSNLELAGVLCRILDELHPLADRLHETRIQLVSDRPGHDFRYAIDASKVKRELGWSPRSDFDVTIRSTVKWYLENRTWWENILGSQGQLDRQGKGQCTNREADLNREHD